MNNKKQTILSGGLISSAGLLISKVLSVLYLVPFYAIMGSTINRAYYTASYNIYAYVLLIATAGLPFAVSTLVARYASRDDYKMCLLVKKISLIAMGTLGFIAMLIMMLLSSTIAQAIVPQDGDVKIMQITIIILSIAIFIIPILSSIRGFYNGLKQLEIYSISQVLEQLVRIVFLLGAGAIAVYVFKVDRIWSVYFSVFAATIAGATTILYFIKSGKGKLLEVKKLAAEQGEEYTHDAKFVLQQLIIIAIPFFLNAVFGYCDSIINQFDLKPGLDAYGQMAYSSEVVAGYGQALKVIAIPMTLVPGFSAAIIPYITIALEQNKVRLMRKYVMDCFDTVVYIALPLSLAIFFFAQPITVVLFGADEYLGLYTFILKWHALEALCATICPIFATIGLALQERNKVVFYTIVFFFIKLLTNRFLIAQFGIGGMIISSLIAYTAFALLNVYTIKKKINFNFKYSIRKLYFMAIGLLGFSILAMIYQVTGMIAYDEHRVITLLLLGFMGVTTCGVYFIITALFQVPQSILKLDLSKITSKLRGSK